MDKEKDFKKMTINERVKYLRTEKLNLGQEVFGQAFGIGRGGVDGIEKNKKFDATNRNFKLICQAYHVNAEWLKTGEGEIFKTSTGNEYLDELCNRYELDGLSRQVLEKYLSFPPELREVIADWLLSSFDFVEDIEKTAGTKKRKNELKADVERGQAAQKELEKIEAAEQAALIKESLGETG